MKFLSKEQIQLLKILAENGIIAAALLLGRHPYLSKKEILDEFYSITKQYKYTIKAIKKFGIKNTFNFIEGYRDWIDGVDLDKNAAKMNNAGGAKILEIFYGKPKMPKWFFRGMSQLGKVPEPGQPVLYTSKKRKSSSWTSDISIAKSFCEESGFNNMPYGDSLVLAISSKDMKSSADLLLYPPPLTSHGRSGLKEVSALGIDSDIKKEAEWAFLHKKPIPVSGISYCKESILGSEEREKIKKYKKNLKESIKIRVGEEDKEVSTKINLEIRQTINGDIMIFDHEDIDIILMPEKGKVLTYAKDIMDDKVYATQNRLMKYLTNKGLIDPSSIKASNIYSSLECKLLQSAHDINGADLTLLNVAKWIEDEKPHFMYMKASEEREAKYLTEPDDEHSTELGEVPHASKKGTVATGHVSARSLYFTEGIDKERAEIEKHKKSLDEYIEDIEEEIEEDIEDVGAENNRFFAKKKRRE